VGKSGSAAKRERQNKTRRMRNKETKSAVRTAVKKFQIARNSEDTVVTKEKFDLAIKLLDKAGTKGVLHRNTVARKKSRLQKQYNALTVSE
jgi:small subunit ribosomal protein S20